MNFRHTLCASILLAAAVASGHAQQIRSTCPTGPFTPGAPVTTTFTYTQVDPFGNTPSFQWVLLNAPAQFKLNGTGSTVTVTGPAPATPGSFPVTVQILLPSTPSPMVVGPVSCTIAVQSPITPLQIVGACPTFPFPPGTFVTVPLSATGGSGRYIWSIQATPGFGLSSTTGSNTSVQGTTGVQPSSFTVTLADTNTEIPSRPVTFSCTIAITLPTLAIGGVCPTAPILPGAAVSIPLTGVGGSGSFSWQISPGNSGLNLSAVSGATTIVQGNAPTTPGQYSFSVTLLDPIGRTSVVFTCSITVVAPLQITGTCPTQPIVSGILFTLPLSVTGGIAPFRWTVTGPFTPSATTGSAITLSGTPATPGSFDINVTVQDTSGIAAATFKCTVRVVAPLSITGPPCPVLSVQGRTFSIPLSATGGTGNFTWSISGPSFASLSATTGASVSVGGSSTSAGTFAFTVTVRDDANTPLSAPFSCSLQIALQLLLQSQTLPDGVVNQAYPGARLTASGGTPPLSFRVVNGNLPPGLQLNPTGAISGTPTQAGTFSFSVTVSDSGDQSSTADFQIRIVPLLVNTTVCPLPVGRELQSFTANLTAIGGTGQFTFSLADSTLLPPGLVLSQNAITGTPQGPSSTNLALQVTSGTQSIRVNCQLTILGRMPVVTVNGFFVSAASPLLTSSIALDAPVQQDVTGTAVLSFTPDVPNTSIKDNPQVQFCGGDTNNPLCSAAKKDAAGLLRTIPFTISAGTQGLDLSPALQSNVAGTIQIALTGVTMGGQSITVPPLQFTIARTPPQVLSNPQVSFAGDTLQVSLKVSSSTCELTSAAAVFTPAAGSEIEGTTQSVDLTGLFRSFTPFAVDAAHPTGGCAFTLNLPFNVSGDHSAIARVDLALKNSVGAAPVVTSVLQP